MSVGRIPPGAALLTRQTGYVEMRKLSKPFASLLVMGGLLATLTASATTSQAWDTASPSALPSWLEPRGLSVIELVGLVPDIYLQGTILSYRDGEGIVVYDSGTREANKVTVTTTIYPRVDYPSWADPDPVTMFGCLGQAPAFDHMGTVVPESYLRVYDAGDVERTADIILLRVTAMGTQQPQANSGQPQRYPQYDLSGAGLQIEADGLGIPTNGGCLILIPEANYYPMRGEFTLYFEPAVQASVVGSQQASFRTYIGPGNVGIFQPLMTQMTARYGTRHGRIDLNIPAGANYFLLKYPPMIGDATTDTHLGAPNHNRARYSSGTYRLGEAIELATDLTASAAFPLNAAWREADQAGPTQFLPLMTSATKLAPLEYVLPGADTTVIFDDCFIHGECQSAKLQEIHGALMGLEIIYLSVSIPETGVEPTLLQLAGTAWSPSAQATLSPSPLDAPAAAGTSPAAQLNNHVYLPLVYRARTCSQYPCGWFDSLGRMLGYLPGP